MTEPAPDPSNTDVEQLLAELDADDDVYERLIMLDPDDDEPEIDQS